MQYTQLEKAILDFFKDKTNQPSTFEGFQKMINIQKIIELNAKERSERQSTYYRSK